MTLVTFIFVDRDMVMRYHWCQGIGHTYCRGSDISACDSFPQVEPPEPEDDGTNGLETEARGEHQRNEVRDEAEMEILNALEYGMDERENEYLPGSDEESGDWNMDQEDLDDETLLQMDEMYNSQVL